MKTTKVFISAVLAALMLFLAPYAGSTLNSQDFDGYEEFDWSLIYPDGFDEGDVYEGGDLGEATITCSGQGYGRCYYPIYFWKASQNLFGEYKCCPTGNPKNYCPHLLVKICNTIVGKFD